MRLPSSTKIYLATTYCDMRKSIDGLAWEVESRFNLNVLDGAVFIFFNRKKNKLKYLYFDGTGFCLFYKRLEKGCFKLPKLNDVYYLMSESQLSLLLDGINWYEVKQKDKEKYSKLF